VTNINLGYGESTGGRALTLIKEGTGTQTFTGRLFHAGGFTVNGGTVVVAPTGLTDSVNYAGNNTIAAGATLKFDFNTGYQRIRNGTLSGDGQFIKAGLGTLQMGDNGQPMNVALGAGVVIDVQAGTVKNDWGNGNGSPGWSANLADLNVAAGAYFDVWDGSATVDAVTGAGTIQVGINSTSTITVGVNNGSGNFSGTLQNPAGGTFPGGDTYPGGGTLNLAKQGAGTQILSGTSTYTGTTTISAGALLVNGTHTGGGAYTVQNTGTLGGTDSLTASVTVDNGGTINPGASVGTLTTGNVTLNGILKIEYNGATIDKLVAGALDITSGTVDFDNLGVNLTGSPRVFASYTSLVGAAFATITDLPAGYTINYNYLGGNEIALVASAHPGDFDSDGDVDGADFVAWQTNFPTATGATLAQGDADGDGDVDGADFVVWQTNFPFTPGPGASPVPEPQSWLLIAVGAMISARAFVRPRFARS
jgi:autotransporter-associated beta strand protein